MTTALTALLRRLLPRPAGDTTAEPIAARARIRGAAGVLEVRINGLGRELLHVSRAGGFPQTLERGRAMLSIEDETGALRIDIPVAVITGGDHAWVLRMLAPPLVLRRRTIRDLTLAEALGVGAPPLGMVA